MNKDQGKYDDIINMKHPISKKQPQMTMEARAAQFAPFDALTGLKSCISETECALDNTKKIELSDEEQEKISEILTKLKKGDRVKIKYYFNKRYIEIEDNLMKLKEVEKKLLLENSREIKFEDILEIEVMTKIISG